LKKQGDLCAGCGRDVEKGYASRFRYCEYTGKKKFDKISNIDFCFFIRQIFLS
jgi:hypothetical protein